MVAARRVLVSCGRMEAVLVGAGVSSLLLAESLSRRAIFEKILLVGPAGPVRPHILSWWSDFTTPFDRHAFATWDKVAVVANGESSCASLDRYRYRSMRAKVWADETLDALVSSGRVERIDATVEYIDHAKERPEVWWDGERHAADWVFDSSPGHGAHADAWQRFEGWELVVPPDAFDASVATLLDFRTPQEGDFRFIYALPLAKDRLFVEHVSYQPSDHLLALNTWLREVAGLRAWERVDREGGATPIFFHKPQRGLGRVRKIGVYAGLAKPATGYALTRMWHDAERIAEGLARDGDIPVLWPSSILYPLADQFFAELLRSEPGRLEAALGALFGGASGDDVLAFLDERASLGGQLAIARAMPGWLKWTLTPDPQRGSFTKRG